MNSFPKKYKTQDLRNRAKIYRENKQANNIDTNNSTKFFLNVLPISRKLSYNDFFPIYMSDFSSYKRNVENREIHQNPQYNASQQLFVIY